MFVDEAQTTEDAAAKLQQWDVWIQQHLASASPQAVVGQMVASGWSAEDATVRVNAIVHQLESAVRNAAFQQDAVRRAALARHQKNMLHGGLWCVGGTVITVGTMMAASDGGHYVIAWGAIVFGAFQFLGGVIGYLGTPKA